MVLRILMFKGTPFFLLQLKTEGEEEMVQHADMGKGSKRGDERATVAKGPAIALVYASSTNRHVV